jgi:putative hydrolase of the HAD superfamily
VIASHLPLLAVLFDAGNTLLFLDYSRIASAVGKALELPLTATGLAAGSVAAARSMEDARATDRERATAFLEALFLQAGVPADRLVEVRAILVGLHAEQHLWSDVSDDTREALARLRRGGLRLGVVSNSDGRVEEALEAAGLRQYFDVVVDSAVAGVEKPDPAIFRAALTALDVPPDQALYVGDLYEIDVLGANAAGMPAVLLVASDEITGPGCATIGSLRALADDLLKETRA